MASARLGWGGGCVAVYAMMMGSDHSSPSRGLPSGMMDDMHNDLFGSDGLANFDWRNMEFGADMEGHVNNENQMDSNLQAEGLESELA